MPDDLLARIRPRMEAALAPYTHRESAMLDVLHAIQDELGYVPLEAEGAVAELLGTGLNRVQEVLSFYSMFRRTPPARYRIQVCQTLTCEMCGQPRLMDVLRDRLGLVDGGRTPDGLFSLETVECLGACELAPAVRINGEPARGPLDEDSLARLLDELRAAAPQEGEDGPA